MVEIKNNYTFAGIVIAVALVGFFADAGVEKVFKLESTGNYRTCTSGWQFQSSGSYEGKYSCGARTDVHYYCSSVRDSKNTKGYYCDEATAVEIKETVVEKEVVVQPSCPKVKVVKYDYDGSKWLCDENGQNCVHWSQLMDV